MLFHQKLMPCFSTLNRFHIKLAVARDKRQLPIRNYPIQENGNGAKDLIKTGNLCHLPSHKYQKATQNDLKCSYQASKKGFIKRCKCITAGLLCTAMCNCHIFGFTMLGANQKPLTKG